MKKILQYYNKIKNKGFIEIVFSTTLTKVMMFLSAIFLPRFLSVDDYGTLTYAETLLNYFMLLSGLGLGQATLKYCSIETDFERKQNIFLVTTLIGFIFNVCVCVFGEFIITFLPIKIEGASSLLRAMLWVMILSFLFQNIQFYLRSNFDNKKYSILSVIYTLLLVLLQISFAMIGGITGVVFARYFAYIVCIIIGVLFIPKINIKTIQIKLKNNNLFTMLKFSIVILIGNFFSIAVINNETLMIGNIFASKEILANYKVGSYFLQICIFFVEAIMVFLLPYFAKHGNDRKWIWNNFKIIFVGNMIFMSVVVGMLVLLSKPIIIFLWGSRYIDALPIMRTLLVAAYVQSVFRAIPGNILAYIGGEKYTLIINICTVIVHIIVDLVLFKSKGINSIGIGLIVAYLFSGVLMTFQIRSMCNDKKSIM